MSNKTKNIIISISVGILAASGAFAAYCYNKHKDEEEELHYRKIDKVINRIVNG